jgi:hypothetical protein
MKTCFFTAMVLTWGSLVFGGEIHDAAVNGDLEKVKALLKASPDLVASRDETGRTPLHRAVLLGHKHVVELLLANNADVSARDNHGRTALDIASVGGSKDVIDLLRERSRQATTTVPAPVPAKPAPPTVTPVPVAAKSDAGRKVEAPPKEKPSVPAATKNGGFLFVRRPKPSDTNDPRRGD